MTTNASALVPPAPGPVSSLTNDLRDIRAPVEIPVDLTWLWWTLGALTLGAVLFWIGRKWMKPAAPIVVAPIPAHLRAKQKLRDALALINQPLPFCVAVSDTIRLYLEERFNFRAPERTTEEFLLELKATNLVTPEQKESLADFLSRCDLVKFARYEPGQPELQQIYDSAVRLVDGTEPPSEIPREEGPENGAFAAASQVREHANRITGNTKAEGASKGKTLAVIGVLLQIGPSAWIVAYVVMLFRMNILAENLLQPVSNKGIAAFAELPSQMYSQMFSIYREALLLACFGLIMGVVGLILLVISLVSQRYRAEWFFWFLVIYGFILVITFPCVGTAVGIFFIVYCITKRREFLNRI